MNKEPTPEQIEGLKKKYANYGSDVYDISRIKIKKAKPQTPEGWKEQEK